jgi:ankyrin repeat protein
MKTLHRALETQDLALLKQAVEKEGANVNFQEPQSMTFCPLVHAVSHKWFDGASYLINSKANVNAHHSDGWSILQESAFQSNNAKITRLLLEKGADADRVAYDGLTAVSTALTDRTSDSLRELCRVSKNLEVRDTQGHTPLFRTVKYYEQLAAAVLLDAGAKVSSFELVVLPEWFEELVAQRKKLKQTLAVLFALSRPLVGKDVAKILIDMVWETRDADEWKVETKKSKN